MNPNLCNFKSGLFTAVLCFPIDYRKTLRSAVQQNPGLVGGNTRNVYYCHYKMFNIDLLKESWAEQRASGGMERSAEYERVGPTRCGNWLDVRSVEDGGL